MACQAAARILLLRQALAAAARCGAPANQIALCATASIGASAARHQQHTELPPLPHPWQSQQRLWSSQTGGGDVADKLSGMIDVMLANPQLAEMLMIKLPAHVPRTPEVLRAMMANPEVRERLAQLAKQTGLDRMLSGVDPQRMAAGMAASADAGLDPPAIFAAFSASPSLSARMQDPRVLAAMMDMASNGPEALKKYEGDKEVLEAAMEAGDIITRLQAERQGGGSAGSGGGSGSASVNAVQQQLGANPQELMQRLMSRPDLLARVQDPKVQAALQEVAASPWKIVKYLFNPQVMGALKEMKELLSAGRPPKP